MRSEPRKKEKLKRLGPCELKLIVANAKQSRQLNTKLTAWLVLS